MSDITITVNSVPKKYKDMGDGTFAEVVYVDTTTTPPSSDVIITTNSVSKRYRNMGDGTFAEVLAT